MEKSIQVGGEARRWANPTDREKWSIFTRLVPGCDPIGHLAVVILTNAAHTEAALVQLTDIQRELPTTMQKNPQFSVTYWRNLAKPEEGESYLQKLTERPIFADRI